MTVASALKLIERERRELRARRRDLESMLSDGDERVAMGALDASGQKKAAKRGAGG